MNAEEAHDMDDDEPYYMNEEEPYDIARAIDSDDDRPVRELTESDVELMKRVLPGVDIRVHEFSNLELSGMAIAEGRDDDLLDAPEASHSCARRAGALRPLPHLVVACTYCSFGCGLVSRLVVHRFSLVALCSPMLTLDIGPQLLTSGTRSVYLTKGNLERMLSTRTRWILSLPAVYVIYFELVTLL
jgi:hypothetical protein